LAICDRALKLTLSEEQRHPTGPKFGPSWKITLTSYSRAARKVIHLHSNAFEGNTLERILYHEHSQTIVGVV
jgi:hypothetical protein